MQLVRQKRAQVASPVVLNSGLRARWPTAVSLKLIICAPSRRAAAQEGVLSRVLVALQKPQPFESTFNGAEGASVFSCDGRYGLAFGEFDLELLFFLLAPFFAYALG